MAVNPQRPGAPRPAPPSPRPPAPRPPARPPARPAPNTPRQPPRTPAPRPTPRPIPVRESSPSRRAPTRIDVREPPRSSWSIGRWWRNSWLAAVGAYMDMSNVAPDQTLGALSPRAFNDLAAPQWPQGAANPVMRGGRLVGLEIHPVDFPVIRPMPVEVPDVVPDWQPMPQPRPRARPAPRPRPTYAPVELPGTRTRVDHRTGVRPRPSSRNRTQAETTIVIERVGPSPKSAIRVRAVQRFKYQIYARQVRRVDAKGVYLRLQGLITATFGTLTEVQDFVEAAAWNVVDARGVPAMLLVRGAALDATEDIENNLVRGAVVNFRAYHEVFSGLMDGRYQLDLGGFAFDYAMAQAADNEIAGQGKIVERVARRMGLDSMMGVEGMLGMHRRLNDMPREQRMSYVREIQKQWRSTFKGRVYWSRKGIRTA